MKSSVVNIESVSNNSFGTGFVIDSDAKGVYILTCQHVLDDVQTPVVENVLAKVIAKGEFIDMAVLYVSKLHLNALPLQIAACEKLDVEVIGFSTFNQNLTQKKHINATLYTDSIELHSKEDDSFYNVRKIKANDGFNFDRGNSGSPVICKTSGKVIAMISNKEGSDIGYAIDIENIKTIWEEIPQELLEVKKEKIKSIIEPVSGEKDHSKPLINETKEESNASFLKYIIALLVLVGLGFGAYTVLVPKGISDQEQLALDKKREAYKRELQAREAEQKKEELARLKREKENQERQRLLQESKNILAKTLAYEKAGFDALLHKKYALSLQKFTLANKLKPSFHHVGQITLLLKNNLPKMNNFLDRRKVLSQILNKYSKYAPANFEIGIKKQLKIAIIKPDKLPIIIKDPLIIRQPRVIDFKDIRLKEPSKRDLSKVQLRNPIEAQK